MKTIGVFGGASPNICEDVLEMSNQIGQSIKIHGYDLVIGGGSTGVMGTVVDGFNKYTGPGKAIGITTQHLADNEGVHEDLDQIHIVGSLATRKNMVISLSDILVVLPGGFGTLNEIMEVLTLQQIGLTSKPLIVVSNNQQGPGHWHFGLYTLIGIMAEMGTIPRDYTKGINWMNEHEFDVAAMFKFNHLSVIKSKFNEEK